MKNLFVELRRVAFATWILAVVCCGFYPLLVYVMAEWMFPGKAHGSLIRDGEGRIRGSALLGQNFAAPGYFHSRPSAAGQGYDATGSGGSNLGPTSQKLRDEIARRIALYRAENGVEAKDLVPADAVMASGSGLDPHISLRNADLQAVRVAKARTLSVDRVRQIIRENTDPRGLGILGEKGVNVLRLNLALDQLGYPK